MSDYRPSPAVSPGLPATKAHAFSASGVSPRTVTLTIPEPGVYLATVRTNMLGGNHVAVATCLIHYLPASAGAAVMLKTVSLGTALGSAFISGVSVGDPNEAGEVVITTTFTTEDSRTVLTGMTARTLMDRAQLLAYPY